MTNPKAGPREGADGRERLLRLLLAVARGGSVEEVAREAGVSPEEARILIASLASQGYVARPGGGGGCPCSRCPLRGICGGRARAGGGDAFILTEKGRRLLAQLAALQGRSAS